jgi:hypothetical protein
MTVQSMFDTRRAWRRRAVFVVLTALIAAGCVGAQATPPESASPDVGPTETVSTMPTASPTPTATPVGGDTSDTSDATDAADQLDASPTAVVDPLPSVAAAPAGTWRSIKWTALPATPDFGAQSLPDGATFQVFGWSKGYVGFSIAYEPVAQDEPTDEPTEEPIDYTYVPPTVIASYSTDGVHWHVGQSLDPVAAGSKDLQVFQSVIEGPNGLLAVGWSGACGSVYLDALWTSPDGITWQPVDAGKVFGVDPWSIVDVSGGAAGYVAVAYKGAGVWTSKDGRTWHRVALTGNAFKNALVDDGTALSGGYVLAGTKGTADCGVITYDGPTPAPPLRTVAAWWSADGSSWTHIALPGATASSGYQLVWTSHLSDSAVLLVDDIDSSRYAWATHDGRTWVPVGFPGDLYRSAIVTGAQHNLVVESDGDGSTPAELRLRTIGDDFGVVSVGQTGDVPKLVYSDWDGFSYGICALGPTGVVVTTGNGSQLWFGTPSAG